jgi:hypothetical protein
MLLAPYLSERLAAWIASGRRDPILDPFDPDRFEASAAGAETSGDYYTRYARGPSGR